MAKVYTSNCGFRSEGERLQFQRFKEVLPDDYILDHNFYVFEKNPLRMWEIDLCIISEWRIFLIDHKGSYNGGHEKVVEYRDRLLNSLSDYHDIERKDLPWVIPAMIIDKPWKSSKPTRKVVYFVNSKKTSSETKLFYQEVIRKAFGQKTPLKIEEVYELVTNRKAVYKQETRINMKSFDIFNQISDYADRTENGQPISEYDVENLIQKQIETCAPLHLYASEILYQTHDSRYITDKEGKKKYLPFFLHRPGIDYLRKFRPVYFLPINESEENDFTNHIQLAFHIGRGDKFNLNTIPSTDKLKDKRLPHIAVKLAIFQDMDANRLSPIIQRLKIADEEQRLKQIIFELDKRGSQHSDPFYFVYSKHHYKESKMEVMDKDTADKFIKIVRNFNRPECRYRDFGFVKYFFCEKREVKDMLKNKKNAVKILKEEFEKLLPLYDFMMERKA